MQNEAGNGLIFQKIKNVTTEVIVRDVWRVTRDAEQRRQSFSFLNIFYREREIFVVQLEQTTLFALANIFYKKNTFQVLSTH